MARIVEALKTLQFKLSCESVKADRKIWLHVPLGTYGPPTVTLTKLSKFKRETSKKLV